MPALVQRRIRAPQDDGAALIDPPFVQFRTLVERNLTLANSWQATIFEQPLRSFRRSARAEFLDAATSYTADNRDISWLPSDLQHVPLVLAGHQPELFHSGVWFKNFLLSATAQQLQGIGVNLIVDTDTVRTTSIRVPARNGADVMLENIAFDAPGEVIPFEERRILDSSLFASFEQRANAAFQSCFAGTSIPFQPLLVGLWQRARRAVNQGPAAANLGLILAQSRHWLESHFGLRTLEVPLSRIAQSRHFRSFSAHLLAHLPRLWDTYNVALSEYRQANHIRSDTHPVPSLQTHGEWLEAPFFIWSASHPRRRHLFVRQERDSLLLSDRQGTELSLEVSAEGPADRAVEQLAAAEAHGIKLRPRALITTMYARLVLSDLFIHGIGGAKYDELTDLIIRRFFGIEPPAYVTATATFRLPIDRPQVSMDDVRQSVQRIRELRYRPESFVRDSLVAQDADLSAKLAALAAEKRAFLDQHDLRRCSPDVFDRLDRLKLTMSELLNPVERELLARHAELIEQAKQSQLLGSRDFSFVLFPSEILPARLLDLCKVSS